MAGGLLSTNSGGDGGNDTSNGQQGDATSEHKSGVAYNSSVDPPFRRWKSSDSASAVELSSVLRNKSPIPPDGDPAVMETQQKKSVRWGANTEHHDVRRSHVHAVANAAERILRQQQQRQQEQQHHRSQRQHNPHIPSIGGEHAGLEEQVAMPRQPPQHPPQQTLQQQQHPQQQPPQPLKAGPAKAGRGFGFKAPCRIHPDQNHLWRDCPNNPQSNKFCGINYRTMNNSADVQHTTQLTSSAAAMHQQSLLPPTSSVSLLSSLGGSLSDRNISIPGGNNGGRNATTNVDTTFRRSNSAPTTSSTNGGGDQRLAASSSTAAAAAAAAASSTTSMTAIPRKRPNPNLPPMILPSSSKKTRLVDDISPRSNSSGNGGAGGGTNSNMFNTTNAARPIPRKTVPRKVTNGISTTSIPPPLSTSPLPENIAAAKSATTAAKSSLSVSESNGMESGISVPRKKQKSNPELLHKMKKKKKKKKNNIEQETVQRTVVEGTRGRRKRKKIRAPSGSDAMPLQKYTSTRLVSRKAAFEVEIASDADDSSDDDASDDDDDDDDAAIENAAARMHNGNGLSLLDLGEKDDSSSSVMPSIERKSESLSTNNPQKNVFNENDSGGNDTSTNINGTTRTDPEMFEKILFDHIELIIKNKTECESRLDELFDPEELEEMKAWEAAGRPDQWTQVDKNSGVSGPNVSDINENLLHNDAAASVVYLDKDDIQSQKENIDNSSPRDVGSGNTISLTSASTNDESPELDNIVSENQSTAEDKVIDIMPQLQKQHRLVTADTGAPATAKPTNTGDSQHVGIGHNKTCVAHSKPMSISNGCYSYGDKYSLANVEARKNSDGTVIPVSAPKLAPDGTYLRPVGRQRKGMDWDTVKGCWYPISNGGGSSHDGSDHDEDSYVDVDDKSLLMNGEIASLAIPVAASLAEQLMRLPAQDLTGQEQTGEFIDIDDKPTVSSDKDEIVEESNTVPVSIHVPVEPKKPAAVFALFVADSSKLMKDELKNMSQPERMKYWGEKWKTMNEDEKCKYKDQYATAQKQYKKDYKQYEKEMETMRRLKQESTTSSFQNMNGIHDDSESPASPISGFVTCDKCGMVFGDTNDAIKHESNCDITNHDNRRVFHDEVALFTYIREHNLTGRLGTTVREEDWIFFRTVPPDNAQGPILVDTGDGDEQISESASDQEECDDSEDDSEEEEEALEMTLVKHLCSTIVDPASGLPTQHLTVMCGETETLYDFRVDVKTSNIPNAGYGAFLTYLGARVLTKEASDRSKRLLDKHVHCDNLDTLQPLQAQSLGGRRMSVKLTGNNLHYNDNSIFWSKKRWKKFDDFYLEANASLESFDESKVNCHIHQEVEMLRNRVPDGQRIGFLDIHGESDYNRDDSKKFWSYPKSIFQLDRYGPHRPEDRKTSLHFEFKNFIHRYEPSEWGYDVPEPMQHQMQIVDITDDATGEIHALARAHTPPYVNEVGHNPKLHRNVLIRDKNDRSIHYYVAIDKEHAMKKGDSVELLVNYGDVYEEVRERKGYGRVNMNSSDEDLLQKNLIRSLRDRAEVEKDVLDLKVTEMFHLVVFLTNKIFNPITSTNEGVSLDRGKKNLIAMRRLNWIGDKLSGRLNKLIGEGAINEKHEFVTFINKKIKTWKNSSVGDESHLKVLEDELHEELEYQAQAPALTASVDTSRRRNRTITHCGGPPIPDDNYPGWLVQGVPRRTSSQHVDNYWSHPELPGVCVRSKVGLQAFLAMGEKGIGVMEAYEEMSKDRGCDKFFNRKPMTYCSRDE